MITLKQACIYTRIFIFLVLFGLLISVVGCGNPFGPQKHVTISAGILDDIVKEQLEHGTIREVTFYAESSPADTIYWTIKWIDFDFTLNYGVGEPNNYEGDYRLVIPLEYPSSLMLHLTFIAWGPKADTVGVTFINIPR